MSDRARGAGADDRTWLRVAGDRVVNGAGDQVVLKGLGLGGWLNLENFLTGYAGSEQLYHRTMREVIGTDLYEQFHAGFLDAFFGPADAQFLASLGINALRIPINYRGIEDDMHPGLIREDAFTHLDRAIQLCATQGIFSIIDLHSAPGGQSGHWHCDTPFHRPQLWADASFQERTIRIWQAIADHYRDEPWVAGYNLLNEPAAEDPQDLIHLYARLETAVREIDSKHMLFLDGNRFSEEFPGFGEPWPNSVYAVHQYPPPCRFDAGPYPGRTGDGFYDRTWLQRDLEQLTEYIRAQGAPVWVGEFGAFRAGTPDGDRMKDQLLGDQMDVYDSAGANWSLWTYKDIGMMGLVRARTDSAWLTRTSDVRAKKARLGADIGGAKDAQVTELMAPIMARLADEFPHDQAYPYGLPDYANRLVRGILFAEPLAYEFAQCFAGISHAEAETIVSSFRLDQCEVNEDLCAIVTKACRR